RMNLEAEYRTKETLEPAIRRILTQLRSSPALANVAYTTRRNMISNDTFRFQLEGQTYMRESDQPEAYLEVISDDYFAALGLRPVEGREFEAGDVPDHPGVALVNQSLARKLFPGQSAVGRRVREDDKSPWWTIVGVVPDTLMQGPREKNRDGSALFLCLY